MAIGIFNISNFSAMQNLKKSMEEKNKERVKIYGYIGMEAYDLFKQGKVSVPELEIYFEKMKALESEIEELEKEKQQLEVQSKGNRVCSCGNVLSAKSKFCSKCGKAVEQKRNICKCGKEIEEGMIFCPNCGENIGQTAISMEEISEQEKENDRECICGAKVQEGDFMCMECGRKINF